ncbi:MAG TPA: hypothetical protein VI565_00175, partial [Burkholderiales bacterium]|nr:hypothetical protein [Burkholderiales bacterium]
LVRRQGVSLDAIHFSLEPFTDGAPTEKATSLATAIGVERLFVCQAGPLFSRIAKTGKHRYYFVLSKAFMLRTAQAWAKRVGADLLVTGENIGQVSSQTLQHLSILAAQTSIPVVRPLLGWDKSETVAVARRIGTYATSAGPEVCDVLGPKHPAVEAPAELVAVELEKIDVPRLVEEALAATCEVALAPTSTA